MTTIMSAIKPGRQRETCLMRRIIKAMEIFTIAIDHAERLHNGMESFIARE
jgi:hypothetical protein